MVVRLKRKPYIYIVIEFMNIYICLQQQLLWTCHYKCGMRISNVKNIVRAKSIVINVKISFMGTVNEQTDLRYTLTPFFS